MNTKFIAIVLLAFSFMSCTKKVEEINLKANSASVGGDLVGYMEIESMEIKLVPSSKYAKGLETKVKFKIIKPYAGMGKAKGVDHLGLDLLDDSGMPIPGFSQLKADGFSDYAGINNLKELLATGKGEVITAFYMDEDYKQIGKDFRVILAENEKQLKKFSITTLTRNESQSSDETTSSSESGSSALAGDASIDELLDAYEKNTDDYVNLINSMSDDDVPGALAGYADLLQSTTSMEMKLKNMKGKMSTDQASRMLKIQTKMLKAVSQANAKQAKKNR